MLSGKGTVALVGSGEFLPTSQKLDRELLSTLNLKVEKAPRVVILPTAAAPDGQQVVARWARMGVSHYEGLGAEAEAVRLLSRQDATSNELAERIANADLVYLSGGKPAYLVKTLHETICWQAILGVFEQGGVVAGCSAGAMALAGFLPGFGGFRPQVALGLVPDLVVIPHFDEIPGWLRSLSRFSTPERRSVAVGVEGSTALVGSGTDQSWRVIGPGSVTVFSDDQSKRYLSGEAVKLFNPSL
jgi:cyanophycinase